MGPPVEIFLTTIASQPALRQRQEYLLRSLQIHKIPYISYDMASDEDAKKRWKRKAPGGKIELPGILVGGQYAGPFVDFEDAMEHDEIHQFLRTKDNWDSELAFSIDPSIPSVPPAEGSAEGGFTGGTVHHQKPIGVPGALPPSQMTKPSLLGPKTGASPRRTKEELAKDRERDKNRFDVSEELSGYGLQGVKVTHDELDDLVKELEAELGNWGSGKKKAKAPSKVEEVKEGTKEDVKEEVKGEEVKKADKEEEARKEEDKDDEAKKEEDKEEEAKEEDDLKETDEKEKSEAKEAAASIEETKPEAKSETTYPSPETAK